LIVRRCRYALLATANFNDTGHSAAAGATVNRTMVSKRSGSVERVREDVPFIVNASVRPGAGVGGNRVIVIGPSPFDFVPHGDGLRFGHEDILAFGVADRYSVRGH